MPLIEEIVSPDETTKLSTAQDSGVQDNLDHVSDETIKERLVLGDSKEANTFMENGAYCRKLLFVFLSVNFSLQFKIVTQNHFNTPP